MEKQYIDTDLLLSDMSVSEDYEAFLTEHADELGVDSFKLATRKLIGLAEKSLPDIIVASHIKKTYAYQLINGTRPPSRDKVIQLAFAFGLSLQETNHYLMSANKQPLYIKVSRDSIIIFAKMHRLDLKQTNALLIEKKHIPFY